MPTIRSLIPTCDATDELAKVQVSISLRNKRRVLSAAGDDGIFTFLVATAFQRTADFIQKNDINSYEPSSRERLIEFILHGTDTCIDRPATNGHEPRTTASIQHAVEAVKSKSSGAGKSRARRNKGEEAKE